MAPETWTGSARAVGISIAMTRFLERPSGRIAYDVAGSGPLVVCAHGLGDVRRIYRHLAPALVEAGYRVATLDLRGHGDSDTTFETYDDVAAGGDMLALVKHLHGEPAVLVGNSISAGAAAWAAAERPEAVAGLVLIGPFVRDIPLGVLTRLGMRLALFRPWGPAAWTTYYERLYPGRTPDDLPAHVDAIRASLTRPGGWRAFLATTRTSHAPVEARLGEVRAPVLVVMGTADPDYPDPAAEARLVADRLHGDVLLVNGAGHYPQAERPDIVTPRIVDFLSRVAPPA
jgi:pimeloyl-ACP methyl ester carboxylesterase